MKKKEYSKQLIIILLIITLLLTSNRPLRILNGNAQPQIREYSISAPSLTNDIFGRSSTQSYIIRLPNSYNTSDQRYPVIYFLHGFSTNPKYFENTFASINFEDVIVVLPSGHHEIVGGTFWENSPITGNWEDYLIYDVVNFTDTNFRTIADRDFRGISGLSMGGYSAINIGIKHPEVFGSVYSISPGLFDENGLEDTDMFTSTVQNFVADFFETSQGMSFFESLMHYDETMASLAAGDIRRFTVAYGSAFSPNTTLGSPFINYPTIIGGQLVRDDTYEEWYNGFGGIESEIKQYEENIMSLNSLKIEYGEYDGYRWIPRGCRFLSDELSKTNLTHEIVETSLGHANSIKLRIEAHMIPFFNEVFQPSTTDESETQTPTSPEESNQTVEESSTEISEPSSDELKENSNYSTFLIVGLLIIIVIKYLKGQIFGR